MRDLGFPVSSLDSEFKTLPDALVRRFRRDLAGRARALRRADPAEQARWLHQLAGSAGSYGFPLLTQRARHSLERLRAGADPELDAVIALTDAIAAHRGR